jgi:pseudouridine-5'-phosphate glycosidase
LLKASISLRPADRATLTAQVPVITVGSDTFPAFFSTSSGVRSPERCDDLAVIAATLHASTQLGLRNGAYDTESLDVCHTQTFTSRSFHLSRQVY